MSKDETIRQLEETIEEQQDDINLLLKQLEYYKALASIKGGIQCR